jgi:hypothetical protein
MKKCVIKNKQSGNPFVGFSAHVAEMFLATLQDLHDEYKFSGDEEVTISCVENDKLRCAVARDKTLDFLEKMKVVQKTPPLIYLSNTLDYQRQFVREVTIDVRKLQLCIKQLKVVMTKNGATRCPKKRNVKKPGKYIVSVNASNEVCVNDEVLSRPQDAGENILVFRCLCDYPNEKVDKGFIQREIRKISGHENYIVGKDLRKIIDNLNFKGDLLKAFFKISRKKNVETIILRNPVDKKQLIQLGIKPPILTLPKKKK